MVTAVIYKNFSDFELPVYLRQFGKTVKVKQEDGVYSLREATAAGYLRKGIEDKTQTCVDYAWKPQK